MEQPPHCQEELQHNLRVPRLVRPEVVQCAARFMGRCGQDERGVERPRRSRGNGRKSNETERGGDDEGMPSKKSKS